MRRAVLLVFTAGILVAVNPACTSIRNSRDWDRLNGNLIQAIASDAASSPQLRAQILQLFELERSFATTRASRLADVSDSEIAQARALASNEEYNRILRNYLKPNDYSRLQELRAIYGEPSRADEQARVGRWIYWATIGMVLLAVCIWAFVSIRARMLRKTAAEKSRQVRLAREESLLQAVASLRIGDALAELPATTLSLSSALQQRRIRMISMRGAGLEKAKLELEPFDAGTPIDVCIPLGTTLTSNGAHQTMAVRESTTINVISKRSHDVQVSCLEFRKAIPTSKDSFVGLANASLLVRAVLGVALTGLSNIGREQQSFVTQLAVWQVTDNVDPRTVSIGTVIDFDPSKRRSASDFEVRLSSAIVAKARDLVASGSLV